jgi:hypothetical protein
LAQIEEAHSKGATLICHSGFHARNGFVADSEYLIAFSFAAGDEPTSGGTFDTWKKCKGKYKIHIPLNGLAVYDPSQGKKRKCGLEEKLEQRQPIMPSQSLPILSPSPDGRLIEARTPL